MVCARVVVKRKGNVEVVGSFRLFRALTALAAARRKELFVAEYVAHGELDATAISQVPHFDVRPFYFSSAL